MWRGLGSAGISYGTATLTAAGSVSAFSTAAPRRKPAAWSAAAPAARLVWRGAPYVQRIVPGTATLTGAGTLTAAGTVIGGAVTGGLVRRRTTARAVTRLLAAPATTYATASLTGAGSADCGRVPDGTARHRRPDPAAYCCQGCRR